MRVLIFVLMTILSVMLVLFGVQNPQPVVVRFLTFTSGPISLSLVMILAVIAGAALVGLLMGYSGVRSSLRTRRLSKQQAALEQRIAALEQENTQLRARLPKQESPADRRHTP
ncbi:MAG: LapA family protein [Chloroflexi bacterium]|nr:LapA family protein [Chloroflexota bacterium]